ncbi:MAG: class I SAM-dependent methyltransferase [Anaerolineaceae bacterium]|nr:class I SAM-dependent methyltransferase [Anaerolineaceae bacterium]
MKSNKNNKIDRKTIEGFGDEWTRFDQSGLSDQESQLFFDRYFNIFPWEDLPVQAKGFDLGCGSGRWAKLVAPRVDKLICVDGSSQALKVAKWNLKDFENVVFIHSTVEELQLNDESMDFGYSLGVLHHIPDTTEGMNIAVSKLKPRAPFLVYLYYAFDNKPTWYRLFWKASDLIRRIISRLPYQIRNFVTDMIAISIYYPLSKTAFFLENISIEVHNFPLASYRNASFYTLRTDARDRFGTKLEQRFTKEQIRGMMENAGLINIKFSEDIPYWCAVGYKQ